MSHRSDDPYQSPKSDIDLESTKEAKNIASLFNNMSNEEIKKLNKFSSDLSILGTVSVIATLVFIFLAYGNPDEVAEHPILAGFFFLVFAASSYACFARPAWGRGIGFLASLLLLPGFPIGTIIGFIGMRATLNSELLFGVERISSHELGEAVALIERQTP